MDAVTYAVEHDSAMIHIEYPKRECAVLYLIDPTNDSQTDFSANAYGAFDLETLLRMRTDVALVNARLWRLMRRLNQKDVLPGQQVLKPFLDF